MKSSEKVKSTPIARMQPTREPSWIIAMLVFYLILGGVISAFNLGNVELLKIFAFRMEAIVPSMAETAIMSPNPENARLILSVTWPLIAIYGCLLFYVYGCKPGYLHALRQNMAGVLLALIIAPVVLLFLLVVPLQSTSGPISHASTVAIGSSMASFIVFQAFQLMAWSVYVYFLICLIKSIYSETITHLGR